MKNGKMLITQYVKDPVLVGNMDHQQVIREKAQWLLYSAAHDET